MQPAELVIIGGAAIGTMLIANRFYFKEDRERTGWAFGGSPFTKEKYLETLKMEHAKETSQEAPKEKH